MEINKPDLTGEFNNSKLEVNNKDLKIRVEPKMS